MPKKEYMHFEFQHHGAKFHAQACFAEQDVTITQTEPNGTVSIVIIPMKDMIRMADEVNEQNARNG